MPKDFIWREKRREGRFFRSDDPLLKIINIVDFSLEEICETNITIPDNAIGTIIHTSLHEEKVIASSVRDSGEISRDLSSPDNRRPVMRPLDFTADWQRMKARQQGRTEKLDDDDELEIELELSRRREATKKKAAAPPKATTPEVIATSETVQTGNTGLNEVTAAAAELASSAFKIKKPAEPESPAVMQVSAQMLAATNTPPTPTFTPLDPLSTAPSPEREMIEQYQSERASAQVESAKGQAQIEIAKQEGFAAGYRSGEEQAKVEVRSAAESSMALIHKLGAELETQKRKLLLQSQEHFRELAEALVSSLLQREFKTNPETLAAVIKRAIIDAVKDDEYTVHVHPQTFAAMMPYLDDALKLKLSPSEQVAEGEFQIESKLAVIDGKVGQIVRDLLSQVELEVIPPLEEAS